MQSVGTRWGWRRARNNSRCASSGCLGSCPPSCGGEARSVESTPGAAEVSTRHTTALPDKRTAPCGGSVASLRPAPRVYSMSEVLCMRTSLCFLLLAIGGLPLAAQPDRRMFPARNFPPEIISQDELPREVPRSFQHAGRRYTGCRAQSGGDPMDAGRPPRCAQSGRRSAGNALHRDQASFDVAPLEIAADESAYAFVLAWLFRPAESKVAALLALSVQATSL